MVWNHRLRQSLIAVPILAVTLAAAATVFAQEVVELEWGVGEQGGSGLLPVNLNTENASTDRLIAIEVDLFLDSGFQFASLPDGRPKCLVNPRLSRHAQFWFLPDPCVGSACVGVHGSFAVGQQEELVEKLFACRFLVPKSEDYIGNYVAISASAKGTYESLQVRPLVVGGRLIDGRGIISVGPPVRPCCTAHPSSGCDEYSCQECVCTLEGSCCTGLWDTNCADVAAIECSQACGQCEGPCAGDCRQDGRTTIDDLLRSIGIALGWLPQSTCPPGDVDGDGEITVNDLIEAVAAAQNGCGD